MDGRRTTFHWRRRPRAVGILWVIAGFVCILLMWRLSQTGLPSFIWLSLLSALSLPPLFPLVGELCILVDGVLGVAMRGAVTQYVPLVGADFTHKGKWWVVRWQNGRAKRILLVPYDKEFEPLLLNALTHARAQADEGLPMPSTEQEACRTAPMGWIDAWGPVAALVLPLATLCVLVLPALWLNQPLILLPVPVLRFIMGRRDRRQALVYTSAGLWVTQPQSPPSIIPVDAIAGVSVAGRAIATVRTRHSEFPTLRLNTVTDAPLLRALKGAMSGAAPRTQTRAVPTAPSRCSLCGKLLSGTSHPGEIHICEDCSRRTRHEAAEAGHGPAGRDPRPI